MYKGQSEIQMIWLMILIIVGVGAWFLDAHFLTYLCGLAFVMSVMQYVDAIQKPTVHIAQERHLSAQETSKVPLYLSSMLAILGGVMDWHFVVGAGVTAWIFFFLRWLRRLEGLLNQVQTRLHQIQSSADLATEHPPVQRTTAPSVTSSSLGLIDQIKQWIFYGNPVLKVAILVLVIGIVLLLRFATEHWQLSLTFKLVIVAGIGASVTALGYGLQAKNRSFALALEGLGLATLFLTLFFAYYNHVIATLSWAAFYFVLIMGATLRLSLKQQSIELALMAMIIAYLAPFTLPVRNATAVELITYYAGINVAVAILSTLRPWKILNQIAFLMTVIVGGGYAFYQGEQQQRNILAVLVVLHTAIFVWLSFRFSQLIAKEDIAHFKLKPALDIALIFGAPIVGYTFIYLMYFDIKIWQAGISLVFALVYAGLYQLSKRHVIQLISQSYLSLMLIFLVLIPPILLPEQWGVIGWAVEGLIIFIYALYRQSNMSRHLAMGLLIVAGFSSVYYLVELNTFPREMYWGLCLSYFAVVLVANSRASFRDQLTPSSLIFHSVQLLSATTMLLIVLLEQIDHVHQLVICLFIVSGAYLLMNEAMLACKATWSWLVPKWVGLIPIVVFAFIIVIDQMKQCVIEWSSTFDRIGFALSGLMLTIAWLRPMFGVRTQKEWLSLAVIISLALTSLTVVPSMPYLSVAILPLIFCAWCYARNHSDWTIFWQARSTVVLMVIWMVCSQLFTQQAFQGYLLPILNPFDVVSIAMLVAFIWLLSLQVKSGLDQGIGAVLVVFSVLWLSSYIVLRGLHVYLATPLNTLALWTDGTVQLSLTLLWVSLSFLSMSFASRKQLRVVWILGASILIVVTLKLVLFDLSHIGTLTRVISFLGAGLVMLMIAFIAPIPENKA